MEALKGFIRIGFFIGGGGVLLLLVEPHDSPEWVVSLCSTLLGGAIIFGGVLTWRLLSRRE